MPRCRLAPGTPRTIAAVAIASALGCGLISTNWTRGASPAAKDAEEPQAARWDRLRSEFVAVASPLVETLSGASRASGEDAAGRAGRARKSEVQCKDALRDRLEAEFRLREFVDGIAKQDLETANGSIRLAEDDYRKNQEALEKLRTFRETVRDALVAEGTSTKSSGLLTIWRLNEDVERALLALQLSEVEREQEKAKLELLSRHTIPDRTKALEAEVEKKRLEEQARQEEWDEALAREGQAGRPANAREVSPDRRLLDLLAEATRWDGPQPPWERGEAEFRAFLDGFEIRLGEVKQLASRIEKKRQVDQFAKLAATIRELVPPAR